MTTETRTYARELESRLRPVQALLVALAHGGADSHRQPLPGIESRLEQLPEQLRAVADWAAKYRPPSHGKAPPRHPDSEGV